MASALQIMIDGPLGAAAYNNEFGRPNLNGYFRTYEAVTPDGRNLGYHKPIMIAAGYGTIRAQHFQTRQVFVGAMLILLCVPPLLIVLGCAPASSFSSSPSPSPL